MKTVNISRAESTMKLIVVLMLLTATTTWAQSTFSGGSGEQTDPYQISKVEDWDALANSVNDGTSTYSGVYFKLTKDIDDPVTTMVGNSEQHAFQGSTPSPPSPVSTFTEATRSW